MDVTNDALSAQYNRILSLRIFKGVDVDLITHKGGLPAFRSALNGYDLNLYWHHLLWFLTPVLFLGVILSSLVALNMMKKEEGE